MEPIPRKDPEELHLSAAAVQALSGESLARKDGPGRDPLPWIAEVAFDCWPEAAALLRDDASVLARNRTWKQRFADPDPWQTLPAAVRGWIQDASAAPDLDLDITLPGRSPQEFRLRGRRLVAGPAGVVLLVCQPRPYREADPRADQDSATIESRLESVLAASPDYVLFLDRDFRIQHLNRSQPHEKVEYYIGNSVYDESPPEFRDVMHAALQQVLAGADLGEYMTEHVDRSGRVRCYKVRVTPIRVHGEITGMTLVATDVTDSLRVRIAEGQKEEIREQLLQSQKMEALGTLATGVAHDFNNLTTAINGLVELAMRHLPVDNEAREVLQMARKASTNASCITRSLLTFARKRSTEKRATDLVPLVRDSLALLRRLMPPTVELVLDLPGDPVPVECDAPQIQQVLMNLAVNARDAMAEGGQLLVSLQRLETTARLEFQDTGCGLTEAEQSRIFEPFYTTKPRTAGTGLGLSVVHGILRDHRGNIQVQSTPKVGTTFRILLPLTSAPLSREAEPLGAAPPCRSARLLLVENHEYVRAVMCSALEAHLHQVTALADVEPLFQQLDQGLTADLLILDLDLLFPAGRAALDRVVSYCKQLPILLVTAEEKNALALQSWRDALRITGVLVKPFQMADLLNAVHLAIEV